MAMIPFILCTFALVSMQTTSAGESDLARVSQSFTKTLYRETKEKRPNENIVISPLSIHVALGLLSMGATGDTAAQIQAYLGTDNRLEIAESFHGLLTRYENNSLLQIANKIYTMRGSAVKLNFTEVATKQFYSEAEVINFEDSENAAHSINTWVESKTNNKIKDLISAESLDSMTRLVLVNAIYFNGKWVYEFPAYNTHDRPFFYSETETEEVPMMSNEAEFMHGVFESLDAAAIELPYKDSDLSMLIVLPNERTGINDLETKIQTVNFNDLYNLMTSKVVYVTMPSFKIEFSIGLNDVLKAMRITKIFEDAELDDLLVSDSPLYVSEAVHKAFIKVDEEGTEAAAATGFAIDLRSGRADWSARFTVDHPFLYFIKDKYGVIYFAGKYLKKSD